MCSLLLSFDLILSPVHPVITEKKEDVVSCPERDGQQWKFHTVGCVSCADNVLPSQQWEWNSLVASAKVPQQAPARRQRTGDRGRWRQAPRRTPCLPTSREPGSAVVNLSVESSPRSTWRLEWPQGDVVAEQFEGDQTHFTGGSSGCSVDPMRAVRGERWLVSCKQKRASQSGQVRAAGKWKLRNTQGMFLSQGEFLTSAVRRGYVHMIIQS